MRLDYQTRHVLRRKVSEARKVRVRADASVAEIELKKMLGEPLTPEEDTVWHLANGYGCHTMERYTGIKRAKAHEIKLRYFGATQAYHPRKYGEEDRLRVVELVRSGKSAREAAEVVGVAWSTAKKWIQQHKRGMW